MKTSNLVLASMGIVLSIAIDLYSPMTSATTPISLLSDPFLQLPTATTVNVVWFTEFAGDKHWVEYGLQLEKQAIATTTKLGRVREDKDSHINNVPTAIIDRDIWRHEATVTGLTRDRTVPYRVKSAIEGQTISSDNFTLAANPSPNKALQILLNSDHQLMPMTAANLTKVVETVDKIDGVFMAGDLVNIPDRASEWFDDNRGGAFFPNLQGRGHYELAKNGIKTVYRGGEIVQHAPLFTALGNHEVMGQISRSTLKEEFNNPLPQDVAAQLYQQQADKINPQRDARLKRDWIANNSFNTKTYEEIFSLPQSDTGGKKYYATTFGNVRLISLYVTNIWRSPSLDADDMGRYKESQLNLDKPETWGYGQHIFESIATDSPQYRWLEQELASRAYKEAKYKVVMLHHPPHTLGGNIVPAFTDPQPKPYYRDGRLNALYYDYPIENDYIIRDLIPLLESAGVQLVYYGHSHLWNRFQSDSGMHFLESSNVGNSYGAHLGADLRPIPSYNSGNYYATGNPNGLEPIVPSIDPLIDAEGNPIPYIASNDITVFSIFDTATGKISSYRFDTRKPNSDVVKFDEFQLDKL